MEGKDNGVVSNDSIALEKDETLILNLDQDQEGNGKERKAETDAGDTINLLGDEIQGLQAEKQRL